MFIHTVFIFEKKNKQQKTKGILSVHTSVLNAISSWERSDSVVECLTRDPEAMDSSLTGVTALWSLSKTHLS